MTADDPTCDVPQPQVQGVPEGGEALKPCPFCGGNADASGTIKYGKMEAWWADGSRIKNAFFVNCLRCCIDNRGSFGHQTRADAIAKWNRRAAPSVSQPLPEAVPESNCECGHKEVHHDYGGGTCKIWRSGEGGMMAEYCPCSKYRPVPENPSTSDRRPDCKEACAHGIRYRDCQPCAKVCPETKASPLCECGHAKHEGWCSDPSCLCDNSPGQLAHYERLNAAVSGETAAPAPPPPKAFQTDEEWDDAWQQLVMSTAIPPFASRLQFDAAVLRLIGIGARLAYAEDRGLLLDRIAQLEASAAPATPTTDGIPAARSKIIGIAAEPHKSNIPEIDAALNQLTAAVRAALLSDLDAERGETVRHIGDLAQQLRESQAEVERLRAGSPSVEEDSEPATKAYADESSGRVYLAHTRRGTHE
jgi:hypothetical protein